MHSDQVSCVLNLSDAGVIRDCQIIMDMALVCYEQYDGQFRKRQ